MPPQAPTPLRILLLHGFTQTPHLFRAKTAALTKSLQKAFPAPHYALSFSYPAAPHRLAVADIPGYNPAALDLPVEEAPEAWGWWKRKDYDESGRETGPGQGVELRYVGLEKGLDVIAEHIRVEGPFDGVIGFSQGAAAAAMAASLLEGAPRRAAFVENGEGMAYPESFLERAGGEGEGVDGFVQGPLKFAVCYSGFRAPGEQYQAFYEPKIRTPVLHVLGQVDVVVDEKRARQLVGACEGGEEKVVMHPGGHFVPSQRPWLDAVVSFVKGCVEGGEGKNGEQEEESVEDMEVPF